MNLKNKRLRYAYLVLWYSYGSPLSIHTKKVQTYHVWRHNDIIIVDFAQIADLQWNIGHKWIFRQKSSKYRNFTGFINDVSNIHFKIQDNTVKIFFKKEISVGSTNSPHPLTLTAYPPRVRWNPNFFHQNDLKGCKRDYLDALSYFSVLERPGKKT